MMSKIIIQLPTLQKAIEPSQNKLISPPANDSRLMKELVNKDNKLSSTEKMKQQAPPLRKAKQTSAKQVEQPATDQQLVSENKKAKGAIHLQAEVKSAKDLQLEASLAKPRLDSKQLLPGAKESLAASSEKIDLAASSKSLSLTSSQVKGNEEKPLLAQHLDQEQVGLVTQAVKSDSNAPIVINKLPPNFNHQVQLVAEYIQVTAPNLKLQQTVHIKLQAKIMPDAQLLVSRQANNQLAVTLVSRSDETLAWFNNLAPNLASHLGTKLREPVNVTVKNSSLDTRNPQQQSTKHNQK